MLFIDHHDELIAPDKRRYIAQWQAMTILHEEVVLIQ